MEGSILHFDDQEQKGIIRDEKGTRYEFEKSDWKSEDKIKVGSTVDFVDDGQKATQVFMLKSTNETTANISDSIANVTQSSMGKKIKALFTNGLHNKLGFGLVVIYIISLMLPVISIPIVGNRRRFVELALIDEGGLFIFLFAALIAIMFYGGIKPIIVKISTALLLFFTILLYSDLFAQLNDMNNMFNFGQQGRVPFPLNEMIQWGAFINILFCIGLAYVAFFRSYKINSQTI